MSPWAISWDAEHMHVAANTQTLQQRLMQAKGATLMGRLVHKACHCQV